MYIDGFRTVGGLCQGNPFCVKVVQTVIVHKLISEISIEKTTFSKRNFSLKKNCIFLGGGGWVVVVMVMVSHIAQQNESKLDAF